MSFILDPYLSVIVGAIFFILSDFFQWKPKVTIAVTGVAAVLATLYSVVLYLDWLPSDILILDNLFPLLRVLPQKGSEIMLHSNVTGATKDTFPVALAILFYLLYPLWVYLGFNITKNLKAPREPTPTHRKPGRRRFARCSGLASHSCTIAFAVLYGPVPQARFSPTTGACTPNPLMRRSNEPWPK